MNRESAKSIGLFEGEKVLYIPYYCSYGTKLQVVTIKKILCDDDYFGVSIKPEGREARTVDKADLYTKKQVLEMLE